MFTVCVHLSAAKRPGSPSGLARGKVSAPFETNYTSACDFQLRFMTVPDGWKDGEPENWSGVVQWPDGSCIRGCLNWSLESKFRMEVFISASLSRPRLNLYRSRPSTGSAR